MSLVHRGTVEARGFVLDPDLLGEAELRRRVVQIWSPGTRVLTDGRRVFVLLAGSRRVRRDRAPGEPLVADRGVLSAAPLPAELPPELAPGCLALHDAGRLTVLATTALQSLDPSSWLDVSPFAQPDVRGLGPLPQPPPLVARKAAANARALFDAVPELDADAAEAIRSMEASKVGDALARSSGGSWLGGFLRGLFARRRSGDSTGGGSAGAAASAGLAALAVAAGLFSRLFRRRGAETSGPGRPAAPGLFQRLKNRLSFGLLVSQLGRLFTARQARYLADLVKRLEGGDLEEALRRALPLTKSGGLPGGLSLGLPSPRAELRLDPARGVGPGSAMVLGNDLFSRLRELYRAAFRRLEQAGRLQEAAFVLADLLDEGEEAVAFLEGHGELLLAAQLAEARDLDPALVVRQWFLAGDPERAIQVARRHGAFAGAVARLKSTHPDQAAALRILWARLLAADGDYVRAVRAIWPVPAARRSALHWLDRGIEAGGPGGAELLARKAAFTEAPWSELAPHVQALAAEPGYGGELARASAIAYLHHNPGRAAFAASLASALVRPILRDAAAAGHRGSTTVESALRVAGDALLRADRPTTAPTVPLLGPGRTPRVWAFEAADRGLQPAHDVAWLPDGRVLVALGEAGVALHARDGRLVHRFDQPATRLVLRTGGTSFIGLAPRGEGNWRLARFDLHQRTAQRWCEARLDCWAPHHAGLWFVAHDRTVTAIDPLASEFGGLWRIPDTGGPVLAFHLRTTRLAFVVQEPEGVEVWWVELPVLQLRRRMAIETGGLGVDVRLVGFDGDGNGLIPGVELNDAGESTDVLRCYVELRLARSFRRDVDWADAGLFGRPVAQGPLLALPTRTEFGHDVQLLDRGTFDLRARVWLHGARVVSARFTDQVLAIADDLGRVVTVDVRTGELLHDLRV